MERSQRERLTEELTLVLLYLTSFTEKQCPNVRMAWKTHDWTALDDLEFALRRTSISPIFFFETK